MLSALADAALNRPRALLAGTLVALAVAAALAVGLADRIALAPSEATGSESAEVEEELGSRVGHDPAPGAVIVARGRERTPNSVSRVALDVIASQAEADPRVAEVGRGLESRPGRTTALEDNVDADEVGAQQQAIGDLKQGLDPGPLEVLIGGEGGVLHDARDGLWGKLGPLELLALPVALVVLALAFGPRLAAAPVIAAAGGLLGAVGVMGLVNELTPVSVLGVAPAAAVSLVLGIEACLVLTVRYRDGLATLGSPEEALRR